MTGRQLAALAIRVLAIYCAMLALTQVSRVLMNVAHYWQILIPPHGSLDFINPPPFRIWELIVETTPFVVYTIAAILFWKFASRLAKHIAPGEDDDKAVLALDSYAIHVITFSAIGVLLILKALPAFIHFVLSTLVSIREPYYYRSFFQEQPDYFVSIVQMLFGLGLIYGREGIIKSIHTVRDIKNLGRDPSFPSDNPPTSQP